MHTTYNRDINKSLLQGAREYPVITLTGPRQSGKTTLVKTLFNDKPYYNLENPSTLESIQADPVSFFKTNINGAILDEIQKYPQAVSYLQDIVDENDQEGRFILTGSHNLAISELISQSLAGRVDMQTLLPLSLSEIKANESKFKVNEYLYKGFYPKIHKKDLNPTKYYSNYLQTYIERDVRQISNIKDLSAFRKFIKLLAGRIGQIINLNTITNDLGISGHTLKHWLSILETSYIIYTLKPYHNNFNKRVIKSSKIYFTDPGLASYLLGIHDITQIENHFQKGALFENLAVMEVIKNINNLGLHHEVFFFRDSSGNEVDLLLKKGEQLIPIEIKASATFNKNFLKGLKFFHKLTNTNPIGYLIYNGIETHDIEGVVIKNILNIDKTL